MAVTLTVQELALALRLVANADVTVAPEIIGLLTGHHATGVALVANYAPAAPDAVQNEAVIRIASYLFDAPLSFNRTVNVMRTSGAASMLAPFRVLRATGTPASGDGVSGGITAGQLIALLADTLAAGANVEITRQGNTFVFSATGDISANDDVARMLAAAAQATADAATTPDQAEALIATFARESNPSGHIPTGLVGENPVAGTIPVVAVGGRVFRFTEPAVILGDGPPATDQVARNAAAAAQATADEALGAEQGGDDAYEWATVGNDELQVPTAKVNLVGVQNQIDTITDELAHGAGAITLVVGVLGTGNSSLRYTIGNAAVGFVDLSVTVKVRVQVNNFQTFSGTLEVTAAGGLGLAQLIPPLTHSYSHHHEATLTFVKRGVNLPAGAKQVNFSAVVSGGGAPDVHFVQVENLKLTPHLRPAAGWAQEGSDAVVPDPKLGGVRPFALRTADEHQTPFMTDLGRFPAGAIDAIPLEGEQRFSYEGTVQKDADGTLAYVGGGWVAGGWGRSLLA